MKKHRAVEVARGRPAFRSGVICLLLAGLVVACYAGVAGNGFVFDDEQYIVRNWQVRGGLSAGAARWAFTTFYASNWHPLTWLSHQADVTLFGLQPRLPHLENLALHAVNAVLVFLLLAALTGET